MAALLDLRDRNALVTGASKGIGRACAVALAAAGADVAVHFHSDEAGARATADAVRALGRRAAIVPGDLARWNDGEAVVAKACEALGALDVLVLNHGIWKEAAIDTMTEAEYAETFDANVRGLFAAAGAAARRMKARGRGRIVTIASTAGQRGEALHSHYAASKGAIISFTKSLASELAPHGVLVNCVAPGWVATPMSAPTLRDAAARAAVEASIPLHRVGTPEEIAGPVVFLASDLATFVTGEILNVNGGAVLCG